MCEGEKRTLTIPPSKAYGMYRNYSVEFMTINRLAGSRGFGNVIPPNSALIFETELVKLDSVNAHKEL